MALQAGDEAGVVPLPCRRHGATRLLRRPQGFLQPHAASAVPDDDADDLLEADSLQPELPHRAQVDLDDDIEAPDDDRVRARISDAIRSRVRRPNPDDRRHVDAA
jgi:hypothetical protein